MNFQYIKALDVEYLNSSLEFKEPILSINEISVEKSGSSEEKEQEVEKSSERTAQTLEICLLRS